MSRELPLPLHPRSRTGTVDLGAGPDGNHYRHQTPRVDVVWRLWTRPVPVGVRKGRAWSNTYPGPDP